MRPRALYTKSVFALALFLAGTGSVRSARAADANDFANTAQGEIQGASREIPSVQTAVSSAKSPLLTPEQRIVNGELLFGMKDYERAILVFSEVIEGYPDSPWAVNATFMRGETYYASHSYLSARRDFQRIVEHSSEARYAQFYPKALARLVDVAVRTADTTALEAVYTKLQGVSSAEPSVRYARGKAQYFRKDYGAASQEFSTVVAGSPFLHQARYFQGLIAMKQARPSAQPAAPAAAPGGPGAPAVAPTTPTGDVKPPPNNYKPAIDAFRVVTELPPDSPEHKHVVDLAWMAIGRLFYEMDQYAQAAEAYSKVSRDSREFDTMLFELAWVYVRKGDVQRAERALEVLSITDPESSFAGDGMLLRADLLLRAGAFDKALQLYMQAREQFDPMRVRVETFLDSTKDPAVYYEKLSQQEMDALDSSQALPKLAVKWAREAEDGPAAFRIVDDVNETRRLIKESQLLVDKLVTLTHSSNRVRAFPELLAGEQRAVGLINQISHARVNLAKGLDKEESKEVQGEMEQVRSQRRALMSIVAQTPVSSADFVERDYVGSFQWNKVSQDLTRRQQEIDTLNATVNGLRRWLKEDAQRGVTRDQPTIARFQTELETNERNLKLYREQANELRRQIEIGRAQIGLGDARYQNDAVGRQSFRDLVERETQLAAAGQAGGDAQRFAARITPMLAEARQAEEQLGAAFAQLEQQVEVKIVELRQKIDVEAQKQMGFRQQLASLDGEARDLVGKVAERNFNMVKEKLRGIILRADVGITEQAWEVREEALWRVRTLQNERAREEQILDEELREVLDDSGDSSSTPAQNGAAPRAPQ